MSGTGRICAALVIGLIWALMPLLAMGDAPLPTNTRGSLQAFPVESALTAPMPFIAGHRGGNPLEAENSLPAFQSAMRFGADFLELDVHQTRDGGLVIMHDPTLERTSTGTGAIRDHSIAELQRFRLIHPVAGDTREEIPTLEALLGSMNSHTRLLLEIKHPGPGERYQGIEARVASLLERFHMVERTLVMSFALDDLERIRKVDPRIQVAGLMGVHELEEGLEPRFFLDALADIGASCAALDWRLIDADLIRKAHTRGLKLGAWTVNELKVVDRLVTWPIDLIITDRAQNVMDHLDPNQHRPSPTAFLVR